MAVLTKRATDICTLQRSVLQYKADYRVILIVDQMVICPCSVGTLASISQGISDNLIEHAADVVLKEKGRLIIASRESLLSGIHLGNMLKLSL